METDFEKLGVFYLGRKWDYASKQPLQDLLLYDSSDLVTHAVCIGMTGSGKTGLCLDLIEEAAIDAIPVIAIDVKGDISNLFTPNPDATPAEQKRIELLKASSDLALYTPGSSAGISVSVLKSFEVPPPAVMEDGDAMRERLSSTVTSVLVLMGIDADPLQSREHILLTNILRALWTDGKSVTIFDLVGLIQNPPITRIGAIEVGSIFPSKERFAFAMKLNNLLASPSFEAWMEGEPLEIDHILHNANGKPRTSVFYISHLGDNERMFFVTTLLSRIVSWMRAQPGTPSLRAIIYMDEIFGFFPPVANPPSKQPLLTLLKQARAYGVGVLLATQNPVDLDYKGLSNTGTWFIGRLQTERDKARVLDGLEGASQAASGNFDRQKMDTILSGLGNRVFLVNNVHDDGPELFQTRNALSHLTGPLTLAQIKQLRIARGMQATPVAQVVNDNAKVAGDSSPTITTINSAAIAPVKSDAPRNSAIGTGSAPLLPPDIKTCFLPVRSGCPEGATLTYIPRLFAVGNVKFTDTKYGVDTTLQYCVLATISGDVTGPAWDKAIPAKVWSEDLVFAPETNSTFESTPPAMSISKSYTDWSKQFATWLFASKSVRLWQSESIDQVSKPRESERDFRIRLTQLAREKRDEAKAALTEKYHVKLDKARETERLKSQALQKEQSELQQQQMSAAVNVGATMLGAFMSRRGTANIGRASSAARSVARSAKEQQDVQIAANNLQRAQEQANELEGAFRSELTALDGKFDASSMQLTEVTISPKKSNISVPLLCFAWAPFWKLKSGDFKPAWIRTEG